MELQQQISATSEVPDLVRAVLHQVARMRADGEINQQTFDFQVHRLEHEQLQPRGLALLVRDLPDGRTRFLIKAARSGSVADMIDWIPRG